MEKLRYDEMRVFQTMTAWEMVAELSKLQPDTPVFAVWEGQVKPFRWEEAKVDEFCGRDVLFWDVENVGFNFEPEKAA